MTLTRQIVRAAAAPIVQLGEVVDFLDHQRRPVKKSERNVGPFPYYGANGQQGTIDGYLFDEPLILMAEDGGHFDNPSRGIAYRISGKTWVNNHAHVLRPKKSKLDVGYLCRVLENYDVRPFISGTTRGKLTKAQAERVEIPLPPLAEQRRIAAILDKADALRRKRKRAIEQLDSLTQSIFLEMFGDPVSNSMGWPVLPLGVVCDVRDGTHDSPKYVEYGYPLLTSKNFSGGSIDYVSAKLISKVDFDAINKRSKVDRGDIVMPMIGTIGSPVMVDHEPQFAIKNVALFKFVDGSPVAEFVLKILDGPLLTAKVSASGRGGTQKFLSLGDLRSLSIPIPPENLQLSFKQCVMAHSEIIDRYRSALAMANSLFSSLQYRAFSGQL